jgi:hypothetical protein
MAFMLTEAQRKVLAVLGDQPLGPGHIGDEVWGENGYRGSACSAPYARVAGKVLNSLKAKGLAEWISENKSWGWVITGSGRKALAA